MTKQMSQPPAIVRIGLVSAPVLQVRGVSQGHSDMGLKQVEDRFPVAAIAFHYSMGATFGDQSFAEPLNLAHNRAKLLDLGTGFISCAAGHDADQDELLANIDTSTSLENRFDHPLFHCGQAAGGELGILFYGLRRGTNQVYVIRRQVRLSFGVRPPISPRPFTCSHLKSPPAPAPQSTEPFSSSGVAASRPSRIIMREAQPDNSKM